MVVEAPTRCACGTSTAACRPDVDSREHRLTCPRTNARAPHRCTHFARCRQLPMARLKFEYCKSSAHSGEHACARPRILVACGREDGRTGVRAVARGRARGRVGRPGWRAAGWPGSGGQLVGRAGGYARGECEVGQAGWPGSWPGWRLGWRPGSGGRRLGARESAFVRSRVCDFVYVRAALNDVCCLACVVPDVLCACA